MPSGSPFKQFLRETIGDWDHNGTPQNVRDNLWKIINCSTAALGAEIFASPTEQKIIYHTCKSRFCPSCGARNAALWQSQLEATIPSMQYREIVLTMPQVFWSVFRQNREMLNDLPAIGATAIEYLAAVKHGARIVLMVVQQTYGGFLNFYPHLHALISVGGLDESQIQWIYDLGFKDCQRELMLSWRYALSAYLDAAVQAKVLKSDLSHGELSRILRHEAARDWNIFVGRKVPKATVINHIGRYIRKPPFVQRRFSRVNDHEVEYLAKDTRNNCFTPTTYSNQQFLALLIPHVLDYYCNSMRYFGLLAPRSRGLLSLVFDLLNQKQPSRPDYEPYAVSLTRTFGVNPLVGRDGSVLHRVGSIKPSTAA